jgi:hypothetical protein
VSTRNIVWLVAIVVVGVSAGFAFGYRWGLGAALVVVVASEIVERLARAKRRRDKAATEVEPN